MSKREKLDNFFTIKRVSYTAVILNVTSIILGILYLLIPVYTILWDITGAFILISLFTNLLLIYINSNKLNKSTKLGNRLNIVSYIFLLITTFAMLGMWFGNFMISATYINANALCFYILVILSYMGALSYGAIYAFIHIKNLDNKELWDKNTTSSWSPSSTSIKIKKIAKILLKIDCYLWLFLGALFAYATLMGGIDPMIAEFIGFFIPGWGVFLCFIFISNTLILLKMKDRKKNPRSYYAIAIIGLTASGILMMPLVLTPINLYVGELNFQTAFGSTWRNNIDPAAEPYFLTTPFSLPEYFLGIPPKDCIVMQDILYYTNATEGVTLKFDAYLPPNGGVGLPGKNATLIRIHGGAWILGGKGMGNMMQMNKYFAAQGYVVFDVQYGLQETLISPFVEMVSPPEVFGDFTVDQMVRHIGNFTHYLAENYTLFGADLSSVIISGGSAGGHLCCAVALGMWSGNYTHFFNDTLTIKGYVPFYPANGMCDDVGVTGSPELVNPSLLVNGTAPPCFIYQGSSDIMWRPTVELKNMYATSANPKCAIFWHFLGGHGNDMYFNGFCNQPFLYYMERFMHLCINDVI